MLNSVHRLSPARALTPRPCRRRPEKCLQVVFLMFVCFAIWFWFCCCLRGTCICIHAFIRTYVMYTFICMHLYVYMYLYGEYRQLVHVPRKQQQNQNHIATQTNIQNTICIESWLCEESCNWIAATLAATCAQCHQLLLPHIDFLLRQASRSSSGIRTSRECSKVACEISLHASLRSLLTASSYQTL